MPGTFQIRVYEDQQLTYADDFSEPIEMGRQFREEGPPYTRSRTKSGSRLVIARSEDDTLSRRHLLLEPLPEQQVRITNLSRLRSVRIHEGPELEPEQNKVVPLPAIIDLGARIIRVQLGEDAEVKGLDEHTMTPGESPQKPMDLATLMGSDSAGCNVEELLRWFQATMSVFQQSAANSEDFFPRAAQAVIELVGLDSGRVVLLEDGQWETVACRESTERAEQREPSQHILNLVREQKRTLWETQTLEEESASLAGLSAVVAAPILNPEGEVIGALYGDRVQGSTQMPLLGNQPSRSERGAIDRLEALLLELLAVGVAGGLARLEQEKATLRAMVRFEQFFSPKLTQILTDHPDLLEGRDCEVTILFCDIRGFSRISERLGAGHTVDWLHDFLGELSEHVAAEEGVLVDYIGDELMAMWGAPEEQPDQAQRACRAALAMLQSLTELNRRWQELLGEPLDVGIGINTGRARVGNTGSHRKFKYGPLGHTVNLASRVEGASKYLGVNCLITGATRDRLDENFCCRRLCSVRVINIEQPVELYELTSCDSPDWKPLQQGYESALVEVENRQFRKATESLGRLLASHPNDEPTLKLLWRAVGALVDNPDSFDPIWPLPGK